MHYAVVKCERVQVEWKYRATQKDDYWEKMKYYLKIHSYKNIRKFKKKN